MNPENNIESSAPLFLKNLKVSSETIEKAKKNLKPKKYSEYKYIGRKRKKTYKPSQRQELITKLLKKNVTSRDEVTAVMINEGYSGSPSDADQLLSIIMLRNSNGRISIPRELLGGDIVFTILVEDIYKTDKVTTDLLYWIERLYPNVKKLSIENFVELKSIRLSSTEPVEMSSIDVQEYYVNDNNVELSAPFLKLKTGETFESIIEKYTPGTKFSYNGKIYGKHSNPDRKNEDIFVNETIASNKEQIVNVLKNSVQLYTEKGVLKRGFKKLSRKGGYYYFDREFEPTTFCPVTVELGKEMEFFMAVTFRINPDAYMKYCIERNTFAFVQNMATFDNFNCLMRLIELINIMLGEKYQGSNVASELVKFVNKNIEAYNAIKRHYNKFERIALGYLESFSGRINVDRLNKILDEINLYIADEGFLRASSVEIDAMKEASNASAAFSLMRNYLEVDVYNSVLLCKKVLEAIVYSSNTIQIKDLQQNVRAAGLAFFKFLLNGNKQCIDTIRSPALFLNNLIGFNENYGPLDEIISAFVYDQKLTNLKENERKKEMEKVSDLADLTAKRVIFKDLNTILNNNKINQLETINKYLANLGANLNDRLSESVNMPSNENLNKSTNASNSGMDIDSQDAKSNLIGMNMNIPLNRNLNKNSSEQGSI